MKRYIKLLLKQEDLVKSFIPSILFIVIYRLMSFKVAITIGLFFGLIIYGLKFYKVKKLSVLNIFGIIGLICSTFLGLLTNNPSTIFIYPIISCLVYSSVFFGSYFTKNDIVSSFAKGFIESEEVFRVVRPALRFINIIWGGYYLSKALFKLILLKINIPFDIIYTINIITGYPLIICIYLFSFKYSEWYYTQNSSNRV